MNGTTSSTGVRPSHEQISERAKAIWNERGQPSGQDEDIWFEAERQVADEMSAATSPAPAIAPATATGVASTATALPQAGVPAVGLKPASKKRAKSR